MNLSCCCCSSSSYPYSHTHSLPEKRKSTLLQNSTVYEVYTCEQNTVKCTLHERYSLKRTLVEWYRVKCTQ